MACRAAVLWALGRRFGTRALEFDGIVVVHESLPAHRYPFLFENGDLFPPVFPTVHTCQVKTVTENATFQKCSPEWRFLKTAFCYTREGEKKKKKKKKNRR